MKKIFVLFLFFVFNKGFSQTSQNIKFIIKDYLLKCYSDPNLISRGNYLVTKEESHSISNNYYLFLKINNSIDKIRVKEISKYLKTELLSINTNDYNLFFELLESKKFDTTNIILKSKNRYCAGGIMISNGLKTKKSDKIFYLLVLKFNSNYPIRQAEFIVKYKLVKNKWKFISEEMISVT